MNVTLLKPYGFCKGVYNVINYINEIVAKHPNENIYCIGQLVHNEIVMKKLLSLNIKVLTGDKSKLIDSINKGVVIFSAHGTDEKIVQKAKEKGLIVYDAACPFVKQELNLIKNKVLGDNDVIYIGVKNHDESNAALAISNKIHFVGTIDDVNNLEITNKNIVVINQTTLSILDLKEIHNKIKEKFPSATFIDEICNSTRLRQEFFYKNKDKFDGVIIVGDKNSNNTNALKNVAEKLNYNVIMIDNYENIDLKWLGRKNNILLASGTSTPNEVVQDICEKIKNR